MATFSFFFLVFLFAKTLSQETGCDSNVVPSFSEFLSFLKQILNGLSGAVMDPEKCSLIFDELKSSLADLRWCLLSSQEASDECKTQIGVLEHSFQSCSVPDRETLFQSTRETIQKCQMSLGPLYAECSQEIGIGTRESPFGSLEDLAFGLLLPFYEEVKIILVGDPIDCLFKASSLPEWTLEIQKLGISAEKKETTGPILVISSDDSSTLNPLGFLLSKTTTTLELSDLRFYFPERVSQEASPNESQWLFEGDSISFSLKNISFEGDLSNTRTFSFKNSQKQSIKGSLIDLRIQRASYSSNYQSSELEDPPRLFSFDNISALEFLRVSVDQSHLKNISLFNIASGSSTKDHEVLIHFSDFSITESSTEGLRPLVTISQNDYTEVLVEEGKDFLKTNLFNLKLHRITVANSLISSSLFTSNGFVGNLTITQSNAWRMNSRSDPRVGSLTPFSLFDFENLPVESHIEGVSINDSSSFIFFRTISTLIRTEKGSISSKGVRISNFYSNWPFISLHMRSNELNITYNDFFIEELVFSKTEDLDSFESAFLTIVNHAQVRSRTVISNFVLNDAYFSPSSSFILFEAGNHATSALDHTTQNSGDFISIYNFSLSSLSLYSVCLQLFSLYILGLNSKGFRI